MAHRIISKVVTKTVNYTRVVTVQVEETQERLKDEKSWPDLFKDEAADAAVEAAGRLTGWEIAGLPEYHAKDTEQRGQSIDIAI